jgi:tetratricopeptide (TPR) repeat protein
MNHQLQNRDNKSVETSKTLRETGNHQFGLKDYPACVRTYTQAILACPEENAQECSLALANRSAALFQLDLFKECISDIEAALERNYPSLLVAKVLLRKAKCLCKLGQDYNQILTNLEMAVQDLRVSDKSIYN